ncbi:WbqC family protein [Arcicella rigui]|uniref:WbqC family protein n=1 Tax=Arcicella rigui TaxID=797020 RepID=A0ABU5QGD4_9BACT|nr:WbqC family protein [Arcicella rigui]MEA5141597.1 WbqC family protein [Arcicella rigui]
MIIDLQYLPSLEYFACILQQEVITIEAHEYYEKQSYRNRCIIQTTNKIDSLSIPVQNGNKKVLIRDLRIEYHQDWIRRHWGAIHSAYGKSPFFEFYAEYFKNILDKKPDFLFDLNVELLSICLKLLRLEKKITFTEKYEKEVEFDFRGKIHPKRDFSLNGIYQPVAYRQNFGSEFVPNLSILDLLFCQGNQASKILHSSMIK